jgi:hypothetical protein
MREHVKWIMTTVILLFVLSCFGGYGLYVRGNKNHQANNGQMQDYPVAEVNGRNVMRSEIENGLSSMAQQYGKNVQSTDLPILRQMVLDNLIIQSEVEKDIKDKDIDVTKDEINAQYEKIMDSYPTREEFKDYLQRSGITEKQVKDDIKKQLQQQKLFDSIAAGVSVDDKEAHAFYDSAKSIIFKRPAGVNVNMAMFSNAQAAGLAQKAIASGAKWDGIIEEQKASVITATSFDKPELVTDKMMVGPLAKLKNYPLNKITPVITLSSSDAMIAIKRSKEAARVMTYDEVSSDVVNTLKNQKLQQKQRDYLTELKKKADVKVLDPTVFPAAPASGDQGTAKSADKAQ